MDAGYTECCNEESDCSGEPADCFCDFLCHELQDCCYDIDETCPSQLIY